MKIRIMVSIGILVFSLAGCGGGGDGDGGSDIGSPSGPGNSAPSANAGADQNVKTGDLVFLSGGGSDADGDLLTYDWAFTSKPAGSTATLSSRTVANPTFTADLDGIYVLGLIVDDGKVSSEEDTVTITAATLNSAPVANAGTDQNAATGILVTLNGSASSDTDNDQLTYSWSFTSQPEGSTATLSSTTAVNPTFTADRDGAYVLRLIVNDGLVASQADSVTITAATLNSAPVANAGTDQNAATGSLVTLDGSASTDADNDQLTYSWSFTSQPEGSTATLSSTTAVNPTFTADRDGAYVLRLIVNDGLISSGENTVSINVHSNYALLFSTSGASSGVKINSYWQAGSQFSATIRNTSVNSFICYRAELYSGAYIISFTENASILGGDQVLPGESVGVVFTLNSSVLDSGFEFRYHLRHPETGETFMVTHVYQSLSFPW